MNMGEVEIVHTEPLQTCLDCRDHVLHRRIITQVSVRRAELGNNEQLLAWVPFNSLTQRVFRASLGIVWRGIEVIHSAFEGTLNYRDIVQAGTAERDV